MLARKSNTQLGAQARRHAGGELLHRWRRDALVLDRGRLRAGDAAHTVPPTGAKGLNLAASDVAYLFEALVKQVKQSDETGLKGYEARAQARIWKAERFSWSMTNLTHHFPDRGAFDARIQEAERAYIFSSEAAQKSIAENYIGLPL